MNKRLWILLLLGAVSVALTADDCVTETKTIEVPVRFDNMVTFRGDDLNVNGDTCDSDTETIDIRQQILDAEEDNDLEDYDLESAVLEAVFYHVTSKTTGSDNLTFDGEIEVTRVESGATALLVDGLETIADIMAPDWYTRPLNPAGVAIINDALQDYIGNRNNPPAITLRLDWSGCANEEPYDFMYEGLLKVTITGLVEVDTPK